MPFILPAGPTGYLLPKNLITMLITNENVQTYNKIEYAYAIAGRFYMCKTHTGSCAMKTIFFCYLYE